MKHFSYLSLTISVPPLLESSFLLETSEESCDVRILLEPCPKARLDPDFEHAPRHKIETEFFSELICQRTERFSRFEIADIGYFEMPDSSTIYATFFQESHERLINAFWGNVFTMILVMRGYFAFHANAVVINEKLFFLGKSGAGKSTFTTYLHKQGYGLLSDDITAVDVKTIPLQALPGKKETRLLEAIRLKPLL